jgi:hypothetical protein
MKLYEHSKQTYQDGEIDHTWQFGIINDISLLWVNFESPGGVIHSSGGINILFSFFGSSLMSVDIQQQSFSFAFGFFTEYFDGWSND